MKKGFVGVIAALLILNVLAVAVLADDSSNGSSSGSSESEKPVPTLYGAENNTPRPMGILAQARNATLEAREELRREVRANITSEREAFKEQSKMLRNETRQRLIDSGELKNMTKEQREAFKEAMKEQQKERISQFNEMIKKQRFDMRMENRDMIIKSLTDEQKSIIAGKINAKTGLNLTAEEIGNGTAGQELRAYLSNGNFANIRVLPDAASKKALENLKAKCDDSTNCTVELKEVKSGNETKAAYEVNTRKHAKLFGIFGANMNVNAQVDAQTGDVIASKKPWWAFLAREDNANESDIASSVGSNTDTNATAR